MNTSPSSKKLNTMHDIFSYLESQDFSANTMAASFTNVVYAIIECSEEYQTLLSYGETAIEPVLKRFNAVCAFETIPEFSHLFDIAAFAYLMFLRQIKYTITLELLEKVPSSMWWTQNFLEWVIFEITTGKTVNWSVFDQ